MIPLGRTLYLWRIERSLTQEALARLAGISRPNLSLIEQGARDITVGTLRRLAEALGLRPGILADGIPPRTLRKVQWSRESLDRMARWIVGEPLRLSPPEKKIASLVQSFMKRRLGLMRGYGRSLPHTVRCEAHSWLKAKAELGEATLENLLARVGKMSQEKL